MARRSAGPTWDAHTACDVLWIPRHGNYDLDEVLGLTATDARVSRNLNDVGRAFKQADGARWVGTDGVNDVFACSWNKDVASACGVFSMQLRSRYDYRNNLRPGDLFILWMADDQPANQQFTGTLITFGIVDRVSEGISVQEGAEVAVLHVNGRDFGAILQETSTVFDPAFADQENAYFGAAYSREKSALQQQTFASNEVVWSLMRLLFDVSASRSLHVRSQWRFPGTYQKTEDATGITGKASLLSLLDITTFTQWQMYGYNTETVFGLAQAGNAWNLIESFANGMVNELFIDVRDYSTEEIALRDYLSTTSGSFLNPTDQQSQRAAWLLAQRELFFASAARDLEPPKASAVPQPVLALVHRQRPLDRDAFLYLPAVTLEASECFDVDIGYAGHDVVNMFRVSFRDVPPNLQEVTEGVLVNPTSIAEHGIKRMDFESRFSSPGSTKTLNAFKNRYAHVFKHYVGLLSTWYAANDRQLAGSAHIRFRPDIRAGTRVRLPIKGVLYDFYVQGVAHNFDVGAGGSRTSLTLVRGVDLASDALEANLQWLPVSGSTIPLRFPNVYRGATAGLRVTPGVVADRLPADLANGLFNPTPTEENPDHE